MDEKTAKQLREPFPADRIGKLPKLTCGACRSSKYKQCENHVKTRCNTCGNWISPAHTHLDYVGHADITDRFLEVDPEWDWEPVNRDVDQQILLAAIQTGNPDIVDKVINSAPPKLDSNGGMWIRVTIAGVTRLGYGDAGGKNGADAVKVAIGDGLRNAGMRFGAGLDMWRKDAEPGDVSPTSRPPQKQKTNPAWFDGMKRRIADADTEQELLTLANEIEAKVSGGFCEQSHYEELCALGNARIQEVRQAIAEQPSKSPAPPPQPPLDAPAEDASEPVEAFRSRLKSAVTFDALTELKAEVMAAFKEQKLNPTEGNALLRAIKIKQTEVGAS